MLRRVFACITAVLVLMVCLLTGNSAQAKVTSAPCTQRGADEIANYDKVAGDLVQAGELSASEAALYRCHPEAFALKSFAVEGKPSSSSTKAVGALAVSCGSGYKFRQSANMVMQSGSPVALKLTTTLGWCYNGTKVKDWTGACNPEVTTWGRALGWGTDGCIRNDFIPYTLGNMYPGGVDHVATAQFSQNLTKFISVALGPIYIWGHGDGTCDHRSGTSGTVYHYC